MELQATQVECTLEHFFSDGVYIRQITMPGGAFVKGKEHKTRHLNNIVKGKVLTYNPETKEIGVIVAPCVFESDMGVSKTLYIHEETIWQTIHVNADDCEDVPELEERLVVNPTLEEDYMPELQHFKLLIEEEYECRS